MKIKSTKFQRFTFSWPVILCTSISLMSVGLISIFFIEIHGYLLLLTISTLSFVLWYGTITYSKLLRKFSRIASERRNEINETFALIDKLNREALTDRENFQFDEAEKILKRALVHVTIVEKLINEFDIIRDEYEKAIEKFRFKEEFSKAKGKVIHAIRDRVNW